MSIMMMKPRALCDRRRRRTRTQASARWTSPSRKTGILRPSKSSVEISRNSVGRSVRERKREERRRGAGGVVRASAGEEDGGVPTPALVASGVFGCVAAPVVIWSAYTLATTGEGLPPGPSGALGALEGVSYLVVVALVVWSVYTKGKTGGGLPAGPVGLLGAAEGLSYLALVAAVGAFGFQLGIK